MRGWGGGGPGVSVAQTNLHSYIIILCIYERAALYYTLHLYIIYNIIQSFILCTVVCFVGHGERIILVYIILYKIGRRSSSYMADMNPFNYFKSEIFKLILCFCVFPPAAFGEYFIKRIYYII